LVSQKAVSDRPIISGYQILGKLGEGGMGVVYKARHVRLGRVVALKMILAGAKARRRDLTRFQAEMEAVARLQHPNIVQLYEVGEHDGQPFCALEYADGGNLAQKLAGTPWPARQAAQLIETLARAIQAAHQQNVIHRDLKPANVLLGIDGTPKINDFGLAKQLTGVSAVQEGEALREPEACLTQTGEIVGSPSYMAPEQAQGKPHEVGAPADIYGLGAILYELLTGRPPFKGETMLDTLEQVRTQDPLPPTRLQPKLPRDLETLCLKALAKVPNQRYATAGDLADDLRRFLDGKPIQARSVSHTEKVLRWCRRNPFVAIPSAAAVLLLVGFIIVLSVSTVLVWRALEREQQNSYYQRIALADREWSANNLGRMEQLLDECPADLRGWEWHYLKRLQYKSLPPLRYDTGLYCLAFHPSGQCLASGSQNGVIKLWDAHTGQLLRIFRVPAGEPIVRSVVFSPDGQRLAAAYSDGRIRIWDARGDKEPLDWEAHRSTVLCLVFGPDGKRLASACVGGPAGGEAKVWDATTGKEILTFWGQLQGVLSLAFSGDGRRIASGGEDKTVKVWDTTTGQEVWTSPEHGAPVLCLAFSPDGRSLASASADLSELIPSEVKLWDAQTGEPRRTLRGHIAYIHSIAFSPDGQRLASVGKDRTVKLWDAATGRETLTLRGHKLAIRAVAFSPDGRQLASASRDHTVRFWDATPLEEKPGEGPLTLPVNPGGGVLGVAFHPDSQRLATVADDVKLWDRHTGKKLLSLPDSEGCWCIAFSPNGNLFAGGKTGGVRVWDVRTAKKLHSLGGFSAVTSGMAFSPDSRHLVSAHWDGTVRVWDMVTGHGEDRIPAAHATGILGLALSPDGSSIVTASNDETVKVWDAATCRSISALEPRHAGPPWCVVFRSDGKLLASSSMDGTIKLWDTGSWKQQGDDLRDPTGGVKNLAFSPDGRLLAWASTDATVKVWHALTKEIQTLRGHTSWVESVAFSLDGKWIASASLDGTVKIWEASSLPESRGLAEQ
jgi:WD40 repeat protein/serine/threonine protein kinase